MNSIQDSHKWVKVLKLFRALSFQIISDEKTVQFVDAAAVHWYSYGASPFEVMNFAKSPKKEMYMMSTEACMFFLSKQNTF